MAMHVDIDEGQTVLTIEEFAIDIQNDTKLLEEIKELKITTAKNDVTYYTDHNKRTRITNIKHYIYLYNNQFKNKLFKNKILLNSF